MPRTEQETTIGNHTYRMLPMGVDASLDLGLEIADMVGGSVGRAIRGAFFDGEGPDEFDPKELIGAFTSLPAVLIRAGGAKWCGKAFGLSKARQVVKGDGGKARVLMLGDDTQRELAFDDGGLADMLECLGWVLRENYGPFLMGLLRRSGPLQAVVGELQGGIGAWAESLASTAPPTSSD